MKTNWLALCLIICLFGCNQGLLKEVPETIHIPRVTQPYVGVFLCPTAPTIQVMLSKITPALGEGYEPDALSIPDATVQLRDETGRVLLIPYNRDLTYQAKNTGFIQAGKTYQLLVTTPRGDRLEGACTVPEQNLDATQVRVESLSASTFRLTWPDVSRQTDYYSMLNRGLIVYKRDSTLNYIEDLTVLTDAVADLNQRINSPTLYRVATIPGSTNTFYNSVAICRTDSAYYRYHKSLADQNVAKENPFAEPVNLYSNIKGGYGIIAGYVGINVICKGDQIVQIR
ncbi:DUF4249 domain-containing protein [uncultured Fibrella sp.]|uniref:DUF4249 domain-containing protein n=1 Tax=uncultured Fibrella sp. TaxID=1284596 RepID=UPI0035CABCF0